MAEKEANDNQNNTSDSNIPPTPVNDGDSNVMGEPISSQQEEHTTNQNTGEHQQRVSESNNAPNGGKWNRSEWIAFWGLISNVVLVGATIWAVNIAVSANKSGDRNFTDALTEGKKSADASVRTAEVAEQSLKTTKEAIDTSNENFRKSLKVSEDVVFAAQKSAGLADSSFRISRESFKMYSKYAEFQNKSKINFGSINFPPFEEGKNIVGSVTLVNYGNGEAKIMYSISNMVLDGSDTLTHFEYDKSNLRPTNISLAPSKPYEIPFKGFVADSILLPLIKSGLVKVYFYGEVHFIDSFLDKNFVYQFCYRIFHNGRFVGNAIGNGVREEKSNFYK